MNRMKKEEIRKYIEAREGLSEEQIRELDLKENIEKEINILAKKLHLEKFPEEHDFYYDSNVEAKYRKGGINPMNKEYIKKIEEKREMLNVSPLSTAGVSLSDDTFNLCLEEARKTVYDYLKKIIY